MKSLEVRTNFDEISFEVRMNFDQISFEVRTNFDEISFEVRTKPVNQMIRRIVLEQIIM